jgi:predicted GIY-YIG superfamily endonuclease
MSKKKYNVQVDKTYYVYLIKTKGNDEVVYVGESVNPHRRFYWHTSKAGKYNRIDYYYEIHSEWKDRRDSLSIEGYLKREHNLEHTESTRAWHWNKPKAIRVLKDGNVVGEYYAIKECARVLNINKPNIVQVLTGWAKTYKGYTFEYVNPEDDVFEDYRKNGRK